MEVRGAAVAAAIAAKWTRVRFRMQAHAGR